MKLRKRPILGSRTLRLDHAVKPSLRFGRCLKPYLRVIPGVITGSFDQTSTSTSTSLVPLLPLSFPYQTIDTKSRISMSDTRSQSLRTWGVLSLVVSCTYIAISTLLLITMPTALCLKLAQIEFVEVIMDAK